MIKKLYFNNYCKDASNIYIADLILDKNEMTTSHKHNFYEFFIVLKGQFEHIKNNSKKIISIRDFQLIRPEDSHYFIGCDDVNILRNIAVEKMYFEKLLKDINEEYQNNMFNSLKISEFIHQSYVYKTSMLLSKNCLEANYIFESILNDIIIEFIKDKNYINDVSFWLKNACSEMKNRENFIKGLSRFIEISGVTQEHLTRELKKGYGVTPTQFINSLRLTEVANMLVNSNKSIIDIMLDCGFDNISYFNRVFKKKFNTTPSQYRKNNRSIFY